MAGRRRYKASLDAAKDEALRACDFYNQRRQQRTLEAFLVHMLLAWHGLLQALNERDGVDLGRQWDLAAALAQRIPDPTNPVRVNAEYFIKLHELVARATPKAMSAVELLVAGKAQSWIRNFEALLVTEFGTGESLANDLRFPVFLASLTAGADGVTGARARAPRRIVAFIDAFDAKLDPAIAQDDRYEFRVLLFQKTGPKGEDDAAIEYLSVKAMSAEQRKAMDSAMVIVRDKQVPVANLDRLRPGEVVKRIQPSVPAFNVTYHTYATGYFKVRPRGGAPDPTATVGAFCLYDAAHGDYVYTQAWVNKLLRELQPDPAATLAEWRREALRHRADRAKPGRQGLGEAHSRQDQMMSETA
jgi:hypothetical protein